MENLTKQENKIAQLVAYELTEKEIADMLFIEYCTVRKHTTNIRKKLGARNNVGIATRYLLSLKSRSSFLTGPLFYLVQLTLVFKDAFSDKKEKKTSDDTEETVPEAALHY